MYNFIIPFFKNISLVFFGSVLLFSLRNLYILYFQKKELHGTDKFMMKYYKYNNKCCYVGLKLSIM